VNLSPYSEYIILLLLLLLMMIIMMILLNGWMEEWIMHALIISWVCVCLGEWGGRADTLGGYQGAFPVR